jgi:hypothetical protein
MLVLCSDLFLCRFIRKCYEKSSNDWKEVLLTKFNNMQSNNAQDTLTHVPLSYATNPLIRQPGMGSTSYRPTRANYYSKVGRTVVKNIKASSFLFALTKL